MNQLSNISRSTNIAIILFTLFVCILKGAGADEVPSYPEAQDVIRFEIDDEKLVETKLQISSTNSDAINYMLKWLNTNATLPFDKNWRGSYRAILIVRFWLKGKNEPRQFSLYPEWKDAKDIIHKLTETDVSNLFAEILKAGAIKYKNPK
jgi:hypothetical protein